MEYWEDSSLHVPPGLHKTHLLFTCISYCYRFILPSRQGRIFHNCMCCYETFTKTVMLGDSNKEHEHVTSNLTSALSHILEAKLQAVGKCDAPFLCFLGHLWVTGQSGARKQLCKTSTTSASCSPPWRASHPTSSLPCRTPTRRAFCLPPLSHPSVCILPRWSSSHTTGMLLRCVLCTLSFPAPNTKPYIHSNSYKLGVLVAKKRRCFEKWKVLIFWTQLWSFSPPWSHYVSHKELRGWKLYRGHSGWEGNLYRVAQVGDAWLSGTADMHKC